MKKILVIFLSTCLMFSLTGCEFNFPGPDKEEEVEEVVHEKAAGVESGTITDESNIIAVGNTTVTYNEYKAYYFFMKDQYSELLGDDVWRYKTDGDKTIGQEAIEEVLRLIIQVKVICKEAARQEVTLEADEKEDADYSADAYLKTITSTEARENGLTEEILTRIFEENKLAEKMYHIVAGGVDTADVSGANAYRVQLIFKKKKDDVETQRTQMENLQRDISSSEKSFYTYALEESDSDEIETVIGSLDERKNLYNTVISTKNNVVSSVVEENDGFYLAYVIEKPNDEINLEYQNDVISARQTDEFQKVYGEWSENYDVEVSDQLLSN